MIQNLPKNLFSFNTPNKKFGLNEPDEIRAIRAKISSGVKVEDLSSEEYSALSAFEEADKAKFIQDVAEAMSKAQQIATKLAKGEKLSAEEERYISEKFPDLKKEAEQAKIEAEQLKERLRNCKNPAQRQQLLSSAIGMVSSLAGNGSIAPIQATVKLAAIEKVKEDLEKENNETIEINLKDPKARTGLYLNKFS